MKNIILSAAIMAMAAGSVSADVGAAGFDAMTRAVTSGEARAGVQLGAMPAPEFVPHKSVTSFIDYQYNAQTGGKLAAAASSGNLGAFYGKCYEYVSYHMEAAGVIRPEQWDQLGIGPMHAADFADWAVNNPGVMRRELKLVKLPTPEDRLAIPLGAIIVYERGVCGFSSRSGHIEVVTRPDWACSDGCESLDQGCFSDPSVRAGIHVMIPVD